MAINVGTLSGTLSQVYLTTTLTFSAVGHLAQAADNLALVAEESSGSFLDRTRMERAIQQKNLKRQLKIA